MSCLALPSRLQPADRSAAHSAWRSPVRTLLAALVGVQDRWRQRRDLEALTEAQLADIGLTRADVCR